MEQRRGHRLSTSLPVSIRNHKASHKDFIANDISAGGACVLDADKHLSQGDFIYLTFVDSGRQQKLSLSYMKAIVVYRNQHKAGLMWVEDKVGYRHFMKMIGNEAA
ncbi:MAG: hypothetical protein ACJAUP_003193 [Cellvibrionaceae bacterium]|jgi:hypothetical protein